MFLRFSTYYQHRSILPKSFAKVIYHRFFLELEGPSKQEPLECKVAGHKFTAPRRCEWTNCTHITQNYRFDTEIMLIIALKTKIRWVVNVAHKGIISSLNIFITVLEAVACLGVFSELHVHLRSK
jgi:hypothetical protein